MVINLALYGQNDIEFNNKPLLKILQKRGVGTFSNLSEISIADSTNLQHRLQGKFFLVKPENNQTRYLYIGRVNSCRAGGCSKPIEATSDSGNEYFDYFILFDKDINVRLVKIFNYQATHGHEISARGWLKQFVGYNASKSLQVDKDIDGISGATISVYAITDDVEKKTKALQKLLRHY